MQQFENYRCFSGEQQVWQHFSASLNCEMKFAIYLPQSAKTQKLPVLYWLSGLTCTEQNFITKSGFSTLCRRTSSDCGRTGYQP